MISNIIPTPKKVELVGKPIDLPFSVSADTVFEGLAKTLASAFEKIFERTLEAGDGIKLTFDASIPENGYRIDSRDGIMLSASTGEGMLNAIASY